MWEDGFIRILAVSSKTMGIVRIGKRPIHVALDSQDLRYLREQTPEKQVEFLTRISRSLQY
jgi:hypothetical protein